jgi:hypothetical protein
MTTKVLLGLLGCFRLKGAEGKNPYRRSARARIRCKQVVPSVAFSQCNSTPNISVLCVGPGISSALEFGAKVFAVERLLMISVAPLRNSFRIEASILRSLACR